MRGNRGKSQFPKPELADFRLIRQLNPKEQRGIQIRISVPMAAKPYQNTRHRQKQE